MEAPLPRLWASNPAPLYPRNAEDMVYNPRYDEKKFQGISPQDVVDHPMEMGLEFQRDALKLAVTFEFDPVYLPENSAIAFQMMPHLDEWGVATEQRPYVAHRAGGADPNMVSTYYAHLAVFPYFAGITTFDCCDITTREVLIRVEGNPMADMLSDMDDPTIDGHRKVNPFAHWYQSSVWSRYFLGTNMLYSRRTAAKVWELDQYFGVKIPNLREAEKKALFSTLNGSATHRQYIHNARTAIREAHHAIARM